MKKIYWMLTLLSVLFLGMGTPQKAFAAVVSDSSSDDTTQTANPVNMGDVIKGSITETDDLDYYRFQLESAGCVTLDMTSYMRYYCIRLYDADGEEIWVEDQNEWNATVGYRKDSYHVYLESGAYYMQINGYQYRDAYKSTGIYECSVSFLSSNVNNVEDDNSFATANTVVLGNTIVGQISENDDFDTFKFNVPSDGRVSLIMTSYMRYYCIRLYDADGEEIWVEDQNEWNATVGYRRDSYNLYLKPGVYYMQINGYQYRDAYKSTGKYVVGTGFVSSSVTFTGDDNSFVAAHPIQMNSTYTGQISVNDDFDTYKFTVSSGKTVPINITSYMQYYCIRVYDINGKEIWATTGNRWNENVGYRKDTHSVTLSAGTYYMQINGYQYGDAYKSTGTYRFSLGKVITDKSNKKNSEKTLSQKPGKIKKITITKKRKALKLKWSKISGAAGYQIRYSTSSKFKKQKTKNTTSTSLTLKGLKSQKTYYVKIRAYKISNGKKDYGEYSNAVKKKTK